MATTGGVPDECWPASGTGLCFGVLGPVTVWRGAAEIAFGSGKHRSLLAALLLHTDERVDRDVLIGLLWGDRPPKSAVNLVQKYVGDLRRSFGSDGGLLELVPGGYRLRLAEQQLDCRVFEALIARARDTSSAEKELYRALALWRGPAFPEIDTDAATTARAKLEERRVSAEEELAELRLARGEHHAVAAELAGMTADHPLRERLRELQMLALYRCGRQADALAVYTDVRTMLADELGVDPGPLLRRRYEQILRGDRELDLDEPAGPAVRLLPSCQLPPDLADFTGRADQVSALVERLAHGTENTPPPVAVVAGGPGVGKTSVAVHAAHASRSAFPDGQLYLDLAGTSDEPREPSALLAEVLRVLGVNGAGIPEELSARAALYRSLLANRRMLLVLDDAASAAQVRPLAPGTGRCAVLVTSRHRLPELPGTWNVDLDVLTPGDAGELFARIVGQDRVAREPAQAAAIVRSCGYLPLAVRIAGAKLSSRTAWSLGVLHERLADTSRRLRELRAGQLEIQANFELSLRHLPERASRAFRLFGLLGPHTLPGWVLGPLLDEPDADETLDQLVDANLLRPVGTDPLGQPRYRMHDLLRDYAVAGAAAMPLPARTAAVSRVLSTWLDLDTRAVAGLPPSLFHPPPGTAPRRPAPAPVADRVATRPLAWFDTERSALAGAVRLATDWSLDEHAWELAATSVSYYDHRSHYDDWEGTHTTALTAVRAADNLLGEAVLLRGLGQIHVYRDHYDEAVTRFNRSALLFAELGDKHGEALAIAGLGSVSRLRGDHVTALDHAKRALDMLLLTDEPHVVAQLRSSIGMIVLALGQLAEARQWLDAALRDARGLGDPHREATVLARLSSLHDRGGEQDQALACLHRALTIFDEFDDEQCAAMYALVPLGRLHSSRGERAAAEHALRRAADICDRHGHRNESAECWQVLGELDSRYGNHLRARERLRRSLALWRELGATERINATCEMLARL